MTKFKVRVDLTKYGVRIEEFNKLISSNSSAFDSLSNWARTLNTALDNEDREITFNLETARQCIRLAQILTNFGFLKIVIISEEEFNA